MVAPRGISKPLHTPEHVAFREVILNARRKTGLTQQQLAERLGKPQSFVAKYEGGERRLDLLEFVSIAQALDTDPVRLLRLLLKKIQ